MEIDEIINSRKSYYPAQFSGEAVDDRIIHRLLENANWAPTHLHTEPWRFKIYTSGGLKRLMHFMADTYKQVTPPDQFSLARMEKYHQRALQVSHLIVIVMKRHDRPGLPETEEISAVSCAVQNMWLTLATIDSVGGSWLTGDLVYSDEVHHFLELEEDERCLGFFHIGKVKENSPVPVGRRQDINEKVEWVNK